MRARFHSVAHATHAPGSPGDYKMPSRFIGSQCTIKNATTHSKNVFKGVPSDKETVLI